MHFKKSVTKKFHSSTTSAEKIEKFNDFWQNNLQKIKLQKITQLKNQLKKKNAYFDDQLWKTCYFSWFLEK